MFGWFKRSKVEKWEVELLYSTILKLPKIYSELINQIEDGILKGVILDASDIPDYVAFTCHFDILKKYDKENEQDFKLTNIKVYDNKSSGFLHYVIYVASGTINGYSLEGAKNPNLDLSRIETSEFIKEFIGVADYYRIINLLEEDEVKALSPSEVYSVLIDEKEYFHLKDLEDGNFIGMDKDKVIYKIIHDPVRVDELDMKLIEALTDI